MYSHRRAHIDFGVAFNRCDLSFGICLRARSLSMARGGRSDPANHGFLCAHMVCRATVICDTHGRRNDGASARRCSNAWHYHDFWRSPSGVDCAGIDIWVCRYRGSRGERFGMGIHLIACVTLYLRARYFPSIRTLWTAGFYQSAASFLGRGFAHRHSVDGIKLDRSGDHERSNGAFSCSWARHCCGVWGGDPN